MAQPILLSKLLEAVPPEWDRPILAISQDSRDIRPGCLFLARMGLRQHGLDFLNTVLEQGAVAIAAEPAGAWSTEAIDRLARDRQLPILSVPGLGHKASQIAGNFHGHPSRAMRVIGITGTNGKTSCALGLAQALEQLAPAMSIGTLGHGRPGQLVAGSHTTPDALSLQAILAEARAEGIAQVAMEVSSHALDQGRVAALAFDTAVFTNLSRDHLDYHGDMHSYAAAKMRLFQMPGLKAAVINADDVCAQGLVSVLAADIRLVLYGRDIPAALAARAEFCVHLISLESRGSGLCLHLDFNGQRLELDSGWLGTFNASNLMAMLGVLLLEGVAPDRAVALLALVQPPPGRMEAFGGGTRPLVVVDYAHTPDALEQVLTALRPHCPGRLGLVFGCGGDRDRGKRPLMGAIGERLADRVILTNDNPRSEAPAAIIADIQAGMEHPANAEVELDRAAAIRHGLAQLAAGDILAVCGKGHENTQQIGSELRDFSDRLWVSHLLLETAA